MSILQSYFLAPALRFFGAAFFFAAFFVDFFFGVAFFFAGLDFFLPAFAFGFRAAAATGAHEATLLRLDSALAQRSLGWRPRLNFADAVDWTAGWYRRHRKGEDMRAASLDQLSRYEALP